MRPLKHWRGQPHWPLDSSSSIWFLNRRIGAHLWIHLLGTTFPKVYLNGFRTISKLKSTRRSLLTAEGSSPARHARRERPLRGRADRFVAGRNPRPRDTGHPLFRVPEIPATFVCRGVDRIRSSLRLQACRSRQGQHFPSPRRTGGFLHTTGHGGTSWTQTAKPRRNRDRAIPCHFER